MRSKVNFAFAVVFAVITAAPSNADNEQGASPAKPVTAPPAAVAPVAPKQPAVPTVMVSSGFGKEIMASRMNRVIAHPAHMGCSSRISLNDPICETVTFLPKGPCSTISRYSLGMNLSNPGENLT